MSDVEFKFGTADSNAVSCTGQSILVPAKAQRVELLVTNLGPDTVSEFNLGGSVEVAIPSFTERIAQWTNRVVDGKVQEDQSKFSPAYLKRTPVAWIATHRLAKDGSEEPYMYCYVFKVVLVVPVGETSLTLPNQPSVKILAATAVEDSKPVSRLVDVLYH